MADKCISHFIWHSRTEKFKFMAGSLIFWEICLSIITFSEKSAFNYFSSSLLPMKFDFLYWCNNFIREISFISETKIGRIEHYVWGRRVTSYPRIVSLEVECLFLMIYLSKFMISDGLLFRGPDLNFDWFAP